MPKPQNSAFERDYRDSQKRRLQDRLDDNRRDLAQMVRNQELAAIVLYIICGVCWAVILVALWAFL